MSELLNLIEHIRKAIAFPDMVAPDQMRSYATRYVEFSTELNRRMWESVQRIRAGNIAEGLRLAELKPNLMELYNSLDFTERDEWGEIVSMLGFDVPPPLPVDMLRELNDAYLKMSPLEPLLVKQRFLALNGSPIRERLAVLRAIVKNDRENTFWAEDQELFEKARIKELEKEVPRAIETKNALQIRYLHRELSAPDWLVPPPVDFRRRLSATVLQDHAETLMQKFFVFDHAEALKSYNTIQQIVSAERMPMPPAIEQLIRPAVQWLGETQKQTMMQFEFENSLADLHAALETDTPLPELERLYYAAASTASQGGMIIPVELENLYQTEIARRHTSASRRNLLTIVAVLAVCLLVGGLIAFGLQQRLHAGRIADTVASLERIENEQRYEDIAGTLQRVETDSPDLVKNAKVGAVMERLRTMLVEDDKRAKEFSRYRSEAEIRLDSPEKPDFDELKRIGISVEQAEKLARSSQEKTVADELKRKHGNALATRTREINDKYTHALGELSNEFNAVKRDTDLLPEEAVSQLKDLSRRLAALQQHSADVTEAIKKQGENVKEWIAEYLKQLDEIIDQEKALKSLFAAVPNVERYQSELQKFVADFPGHPISGDAGDVLKEWKAVNDVSARLRELTATFTKSAGSFEALQKESASLLSQYQEISEHVSGSLSDIFPAGAYLEMLTKTTPYTSETFDSVKEWLKTLSQREVYPWIDDPKKDLWYYLTQKPEKGGKYYYITGFATEEKPLTIKAEDFVAMRVPVVTQRNFALAAMKKIDAIADNADVTVLAIFRDLFKREASEPGLDPILQCAIMDSLIDDLSKIDPFFAANFAGVYKILQDSDVGQYPSWMDVHSPKTTSLRGKARAAISRLPDFEPLGEKTRRERATFQETVRKFQPSFEWVAVLTKKDRKWDCVTVPGILAKKSGDLYILRQGADDSVRPVKVGDVVSGKLELRYTDSSLLQGAPIFLVQH